MQCVGDGKQSQICALYKEPNNKTQLVFKQKIYINIDLSFCKIRTTSMLRLLLRFFFPKKILLSKYFTVFTADRVFIIRPIPFGSDFVKFPFYLYYTGRPIFHADINNPDY